MHKKRQEKLEWKEKQKQEIVEKQEKVKKNFSQSQKKRRKANNDWNEWEDLQKEENLYKKLKKGKITLKEFNEQIYDDSDFL